MVQVFGGEVYTAAEDSALALQSSISIKLVSTDCGSDIWNLKFSKRKRLSPTCSGRWVFYIDVEKKTCFKTTPWSCISWDSIDCYWLVLKWFYDKKKQQNIYFDLISCYWNKTETKLVLVRGVSFTSGLGVHACCGEEEQC